MTRKEFQRDKELGLIVGVSAVFSTSRRKTKGKLGAKA